MHRLPPRTSLAPFVLFLAACGSSSSNHASPRGTGTHDAGAADSGGHAAPYPAPQPDDCITSVVPGHQTLTCEGLSFELTVPDACLTAPCGLIMDVHGFGMNGTLMETHSKMASIAGPKGYIVVQPSAPGGLLTSAWSAQNDDQVFAIMNRVIDVWHVDKKRVHFDGYSMGGWMTWRFVCKHADVIASAAPLAAGSQANGNACAFSGAEMPSRQVPIFYTHGTQDGLVSFSTATPQRDAVIAAWGLTQSDVVGSGSDYSWTRYTNADGALFEFAQHDWACNFQLGTVALKGHCFPGVGDNGEFLGCLYSGPNAFVWGEEVLKFFEAHPMP